MGLWNGNYDDTHESERSVEDDILEAMDGNYCYPTADGGTVRIDEDKGQIDAYFPSDSKRGHSHYWYNRNTNKTGHHD